MVETRCEKTDLPAGTCGDACCRPDLVEQLPVRVLGTWCEAAYAGTCQCGCNEPIVPGDELVRAEDIDGWCLLDHTRPEPMGAMH